MKNLFRAHHVRCPSLKADSLQEGHLEDHRLKGLIAKMQGQIKAALKIRLSEVKAKVEKAKDQPKSRKEVEYFLLKAL